MTNLKDKTRKVKFSFTRSFEGDEIKLNAFLPSGPDKV